jgi:hypothetical protein
MDLIPPGSTGAKTFFLAAVLDWHGELLPTSETIAGAGCLVQGKVHVKAIVESGGCILGHRALELDKMEPWEFRGAEHHPNSYVRKGLQPVRPQRPADECLPVLVSWGFRVPEAIAEERFVRSAGKKKLP